MTSLDIVLCNPVRTAIGAYGGMLKETPAPALGAAALREVLQRAGLAPHAVQSEIMGNVHQAGVGVNPARQAATDTNYNQELPCQ